jgi:hypothetical protein
MTPPETGRTPTAPPEPGAKPRGVGPHVSVYVKPETDASTAGSAHATGGSAAASTTPASPAAPASPASSTNEPSPAATANYAAAAEHAQGAFTQLQKALSVYLGTYVDGVKTSIARLVTLAVAGVLALIVGGAVLVTGAVLLTVGLADALSALIGSWWAGKLIVGGLIVIGVGVGLVLFLKGQKKSQLRNLERKYAAAWE